VAKDARGWVEPIVEGEDDEAAAGYGGDCIACWSDYFLCVVIFDGLFE